METAVITFSNGEKLTVTEGQAIIPIRRTDTSKDIYVSVLDVVDLTSHHSRGFVYSIVAALCSCDFISIGEDYAKIYKTSSVVSVERA